MVRVIGCGTVLASFVLSSWVFMEVKGGNTHIAQYFDFISVGSLKIPFAFQIDQLSSLFLLIITGVGFLIHVYSTSYMKEEKTEHLVEVNVRHAVIEVQQTSKIIQKRVAEGKLIVVGAVYDIHSGKVIFLDK